MKNNDSSNGQKHLRNSINDLFYYKDSYQECRRDFVFNCNSIKQKVSNANLFNFKVKSSADKDLKVDLFHIPARRNNKKLLIISSGVHGIEGFVGSALQNMILKEHAENDNLGDYGMLLIHGVNPYGFKFLRRVTENNVDLNRNCSVSEQLYQIQNNGYKDLYDLLNPKGKVKTSIFRERYFYLETANKILTSSIKTLRQAVLQGQYDFEEGLYFGGKTFEPQVELLIPIIKDISTHYNKILCIDIHTGYGDRGKLHLLLNPIKDAIKRNSIEELFNGMQIDWGDSDDFYTFTGDFPGFIAQIRPDIPVYPITFEFGTINNKGMLGSIKSIHNMITENQGAHYGYRNEHDEKSVHDNFMEMYYPSSQEWRLKVMEQFRNTMQLLVER